jgi:hypothetical protein
VSCWEEKRREPKGRSRGGHHVEFCKTEIGANVSKVGKWLLARDELRHELKSLTEAAMDVEHQGAVLNGFAQISESVGQPFHLAAVLINGEGALVKRPLIRGD